MAYPTPYQTRASKTGPLHLRAVCPACHQMADFYYIGVQQWPERVTKLLGRPRTTTLWRCGYCQTTRSLDDK